MPWSPAKSVNGEGSVKDRFCHKNLSMAGLCVLMSLFLPSLAVAELQGNSASLDFVKVSNQNSDLTPLGNILYPHESTYTLETSRHMENLTLVMGVSRASWFNQQNSQVALELYPKLFSKADKRWGYLSFSYSPDATFFPRETFGGEIYQGVGGFEVFLGYNRMNFTNTNVNLLSTGTIVYLPYALSLTERATIVMESGGYSLRSALEYLPDEKISIAYSYSFGKSVEAGGAILDVISHKVSAEYRFLSYMSLGGDLHSEFQQNLYQKYGISVFTKLWW